MSGNAVRDSHVAMLLRMTADSKDLSLLVILLSLLFVILVIAFSLLSQCSSLRSACYSQCSSLRGRAKPDRGNLISIIALFFTRLPRSILFRSQ